MMGVFEIDGTITEDQFEDLIRYKNLTEPEREALRRQYSLPYNERLISQSPVLWSDLVQMAWGKIRGVPLMHC